MLAGRGPVSVIVLHGEVKEGAGNSGVIRYEPAIEVGKAKKGAYIFDFDRGQPGSDAVKLDWVYGKLTRFHDHSEVLDFRDVKLTFFKLKVEVKLSHAVKDMTGSFSMGYRVREDNKEVIHVDDEPSFNDHVLE